MAVRGCVCNSLPSLPCHFQVRVGSLPTSDWHEPEAETKTLGEQIEEMRTVAWFREQTEGMRLVEEEEARGEFERQEEARIQAERAMEVCVQGSPSLHLCMHGVSTVVCGLQDARRREEAARERKKKDAATAALEANLKALQHELDEARKSKEEPSKEQEPEESHETNPQQVPAEEAGAGEPITQQADAPKPESGTQACVCFNSF